MAVPDSKQALLAELARSYAALEKELARVPPELFGEKTLEGHAKGEAMSVHDLVAYLVGWNELVLKWHARRAVGEEPDFPETGFGWNELGRLAARFYRDYETLTVPELLARLSEAKARIVRLVESQDAAALYGAPWYGRYSMGRMIQLNTSSPYTNARGRLRKWKKARGLA